MRDCPSDCEKYWTGIRRIEEWGQAWME